MVDSVLGVVNELLGAVLGKSGPNPLLCAPSSTPPPHYPNWWGARGGEGAEFWDLSLPPHTDGAATLRRPDGGVLG